MIEKGASYEQELSITEEVYHGFLQTFNDTNPMHVSDDYAKSHGFTSKIMHGNILCGFLSYFIGECLPIKNVIILSQQINFNKPFFLKETLLLKVTVKEVYTSVNLVDLKFKFINKASSKLVSKGNLQIKLMQ